MPVLNHSPIQVSHEVALRIVQMLQKGELDPGVAMQLLGSAAGSLQLPKKRPLEDSSGSTPKANATDSQDPDDEGDSLDDLLETAKRAKNDTKLDLVWEICW